MHSIKMLCVAGCVCSRWRLKLYYYNYYYYYYYYYILRKFIKSQVISIITFNDLIFQLIDIMYGKNLFNWEPYVRLDNILWASASEISNAKVF